MILLLSVSSSSSAFTFAPSTTTTTNSRCSTRVLKSTEENNNNGEEEKAMLTAAEINARMEQELQKMSEKDNQSIELKEEELDILYEDDDIVVVNKPPGILSVPGKNDNNPSLSKVVYDKVGCKMGRMDMMVVHRLSMDTSGVTVFAKTKPALVGMNKRFRERNVKRLYEALVCGHVEDEEGYVELPLMRDLENPPYMRVSTDNLQRQLLSYDFDDLDKKLLDAPKDSITRYTVLHREEFQNGEEGTQQPVTRVTLDSVTGRTNQLNVHLAALGHPIVGDTSYGPVDGGAAPNGGLTSEELSELIDNPQRASMELQTELTSVSKLYIHAKTIGFRHPVTNEEVSFSCDAPF